MAVPGAAAMSLPEVEAAAQSLYMSQVRCRRQRVALGGGRPVGVGCAAGHFRGFI